MNSAEIFHTIIGELPQLIAKTVKYVSGKNQVTLSQVRMDTANLVVKRGSEDVSIPFTQIETLSKEFAKGVPVHVDQAVYSAGNSRSALEALLAHLPRVAVIRINRKKHLVWSEAPNHPMGEMREIKSINEVRPPTAQKVNSVEEFDGPAFLNLFEAFLDGAGLYFDRAILHRFVASCITKPFVVLTGNSGTGKSQLARQFARWLVGESGYCFIPVGAGWTSNRDVIGYFNPLRRDPATGRGIYQTTPALDIVNDALKNPSKPYFLILDEMNLSHVERYFSDFLSVLESGEEVPLHSELGDITGSSGYAVPGCITIPPNLFVIGTVNVDETTYMFSPKVLDRANVVEVNPSLEQLKSSFDQDNNRSEQVPAPEGAADSFMKLSLHARGLTEAQGMQTPDLEQPLNHVFDIFSLLDSQGLAFGMRPVAEILRYLSVDYMMRDPEREWNSDDPLDVQILQKLLPKLHGSRPRLEPVLVALICYCGDAQLNAAKNLLEPGADIRHFDVTVPEKARFKLSYKKLAAMVEAVRRDQFVSFIQ